MMGLGMVWEWGIIFASKFDKLLTAYPKLNTRLPLKKSKLKILFLPSMKILKEPSLVTLEIPRVLKLVKT